MIFNITTSTSIVLLYIFDCLVQGNWLGNQNQFNMTTILEFQGGGFRLWCLMPLSTIFQLYHGGCNSKLKFLLESYIAYMLALLYSAFVPFPNFSIFWVVLHAFLYYYFLAKNCFGCHTYLLKSSLHDIFGNPIFSLYHHQNML